MKTTKDLTRQVMGLSAPRAREVLLEIAVEAFGQPDGTLDSDKELGADFVGEVMNILKRAGIDPEEG